MKATKKCKFETGVPQWIWGEEVGYILDNSIELWWNEIFVRAKLHAKCYIDDDGDVLETDIIQFKINEFYDADGAAFIPSAKMEADIYDDLLTFIIN